jgi:hypothetical protein
MPLGVSSLVVGVTVAGVIAGAVPCDKIHGMMLQASLRGEEAAIPKRGTVRIAKWRAERVNR